MDTARENPKPQYTLRTGYSDVVVCPHVASAAGKLPPIYNANLPPPLGYWVATCTCTQTSSAN